MLSNLEVLDIEKYITLINYSLVILSNYRNFLNDIDQLGYLCLCLNLTVLTLAGNPIVHSLQATPTGYRMTIRDLIPQLKVLDDNPFEDVDIMSLQSTSSYALLSPSLAEGWRDVNKGLISPLQLQEKGYH